LPSSPTRITSDPIPPGPTFPGSGRVLGSVRSAAATGTTKPTCDVAPIRARLARLQEIGETSRRFYDLSRSMTPHTRCQTRWNLPCCWRASSAPGLPLPTRRRRVRRRSHGTRFHGHVVWLTSDQGGRHPALRPPRVSSHGLRPTPHDRRRLGVVFLSDFEPGAWRSPAVGWWLAVENVGAQEVRPAASCGTEGRRTVAHFHVDEVRDERVSGAALRLLLARGDRAAGRWLSTS